MAINGETEREYQAIRHGAGFCHLTDRQLVRIIGDDRVSFLHGMCTADIQGMTTGQVAPALFVTEHSHVIADAFVYALADALLVEIERARWDQLRVHLEKFLVADDVEMEALDWSVIDLEGPLAGKPAGAALDCVPPSSSWRFDPERMVAHFPRYGAPSITILADADRTSAMLNALRTDGTAVELTPQNLDLVRIENGIARVGFDTTEKTLALEAALAFAIADDKGCYIGQETIERATARGGLKRKLCGLRIAGNVIPERGSPVKLDYKIIGHLTSVTHSPAFGIIGVAILHHSAWTEGTIVSIESSPSLAAIVSRLPFANG